MVFVATWLGVLKPFNSVDSKTSIHDFKNLGFIEALLAPAHLINRVTAHLTNDIGVWISIRASVTFCSGGSFTVLPSLVSNDG